MLPRHANALLSHLEETAIVGCSVVRRELLLHWYGQERLTVGIWRDIHEKWVEVLEQSTSADKAIPLFAGEGDGFITFIWAEGIKTNGSWLLDVSELARRVKSLSGG